MVKVKLLSLVKWFCLSKYKCFPASNSIDSGIMCLKMITAHYGKDYSIDFLKSSCNNANLAMNLAEIGIGAERMGFKCMNIKINYLQLIEEIHFPIIIPWKQEGFVVLYGVKTSFWAFLPWVSKEEQFVITDPNFDLMVVNKKTFLTNWITESSGKGLVLLLEPNVEFYGNNNL